MSLLRRPDFFRSRCARLASTAASQMMRVALGWQMYDLTHRAWDLGLVGLCQFPPVLLLALPAGRTVDRHDRRRLGEFESGATAAWLGPVASAVSGGIGTIVIVLLWFRLFPALAQRRRLVEEEDTTTGDAAQPGVTAAPQDVSNPGRSSA